jgi:hypothetical protein
MSMTRKLILVLAVDAESQSDGLLTSLAISPSGHWSQVKGGYLVKDVWWRRWEKPHPDGGRRQPQPRLVTVRRHPEQMHRAIQIS